MPLHLPPAQCPERRTDGFTLIELLVVIAIIGVLTAVVLPSYQNQVMRSRRVDAKGAVLELAARQERFFATNNRFGSTAADLGYSSMPWNIVSSGGNSYYQLTVTTNNNGLGYTATATPSGGQALDTDCFAYVIDQTGKKSNQNANLQPINNNSCW